MMAKTPLLHHSRCSAVFGKICRSLWSVLFFSILCGSPALWADGTVRPRVSTTVASNPVSAQELASEIQSRLKRVPEFEFIREQAQKLGVRAWLFGGTAAGYAHYVNWDLKREKGDARFQKDRFDYDYTNIFRSTQDLDIVVDGGAEQIEALQKALSEKYPHFLGGKEQWEVRALKQTVGTKEALLGNPEYLNQHTDSNSTGMVEITTPKAGESVVRDLRDWESKSPIFLKDVHEGKLHYYFSPTHGATKRFKEGLNPPILSAIRYLTKAFQYQLEMRPEDLERIQKVIHEFNPEGSEVKNSYVSHWIEKNGKKLIQNAVNIEFAVDTLDKLGLRKALKGIGKNETTEDSLAWWMNKEPLRTQVVGQGQGKTAAEVFEANGWLKAGEPLILAHETGNFLAYESITRAHTGDPNVLISRNGSVGEAAYCGSGFYARVGQQGARNTGLTIRFILNPKAREGEDFIHNGDTFVIRNKAAIQVIPESLNWGPVEYFKFLAGDTTLDSSDRGLLEKVKRRAQARLRQLSQSELVQIAQVVDSALAKDSVSLKKFADWFSIPESAKYSEGAVGRLARRGSFDAEIVETFRGLQHWMTRRGTLDPVLAAVYDRQRRYFSSGNDADPSKRMKTLGEKFTSAATPLTAEDRSFFSFALANQSKEGQVEMSLWIQHPEIDERSLFNVLEVHGQNPEALGQMVKKIQKLSSPSKELLEAILKGFVSTTYRTSMDYQRKLERVNQVLSLFIPHLSESHAKDWEPLQLRFLSSIAAGDDFRAGMLIEDFVKKVLKGTPTSEKVVIALMSIIGNNPRLISVDNDIVSRLIIPLLSTPEARSWSGAQTLFLETFGGSRFFDSDRYMAEFARKALSKNSASPKVVESLIVQHKFKYRKEVFRELSALLLSKPHDLEWTQVRRLYLSKLMADAFFDPVEFEFFGSGILEDPTVPGVLIEDAERLAEGVGSSDKRDASRSILEKFKKQRQSTAFKDCIVPAYRNILGDL